MKKFEKQPSEVLDYDIDASEWLSQGDNIIGATVIIAPGNELVNNNIVTSDDRVKIWLSAGSDGSTYKVTVLITTEDGRSKEVDFNVRVKEL